MNRLYLSVWIGLGLTGAAHASPSLFRDHDPIHAELVTDFPVRGDGEGQPATLQFLTPTGESLGEASVRVERRGNSRKADRFPPLKIQFNPAAWAPHSPLGGVQDHELKIVTTAEVLTEKTAFDIAFRDLAAGFPDFFGDEMEKLKNDDPQYRAIVVKLRKTGSRNSRLYQEQEARELSLAASFLDQNPERIMGRPENGWPGLRPVRNLIREFTAYQIVERLRNPSFKTRLVRIKFKQRNRRVYSEGYCFFVEPSLDLSARYGLDRITKKARMDSRWVLPRLDVSESISVLLAEFVIGNSDFDTRTGLNAFLFSGTGANEGLSGYRIGIYDLNKAETVAWEGVFAPNAPSLRDFLVSYGPFAQVSAWLPSYAVPMVQEARLQGAKEAEIREALREIPLTDSDRKRIEDRVYKILGAYREASLLRADLRLAPSSAWIERMFPRWGEPLDFQ